MVSLKQYSSLIGPDVEYCVIGQLATILISYWCRLYWTDTGTNTISSVDLSGDLATMVTLVTDNVEEPRAIVLHPEQGSVLILVQLATESL